MPCLISQSVWVMLILFLSMIAILSPTPLAHGVIFVFEPKTLHSESFDGKAYWDSGYLNLVFSIENFDEKANWDFV